MTQPAEETIWLTQEAYEHLHGELDHLRGGRPELSARIGEAREEGDLRENGAYHAAKEEQGKAEARIRQLEDIVRRAQVGEAPADNGVVGPGMIVTVRFAGDDDTESFVLGSRELATDPSVDLQVFSPQSPLGNAIAGTSVGDSATYAAPNGRDVTVEVIDAKPFRG